MLKQKPHCLIPIAESPNVSVVPRFKEVHFSGLECLKKYFPLALRGAMSLTNRKYVEEMWNNCFVDGEKENEKLSFPLKTKMYVVDWRLR